MEENDEKDKPNAYGFVDRFRNVVLGAAMADQPAMMTASGWRQNEKGDYVQDQQNDPAVEQLRNNLATEGVGVMLGEFGIPAAYGLYNLGIRGLGKAGSNWARAKLISREIDSAKQIPTITIDNAYKMTDEDWDLAYEQALKFGDSEELNNLRALHFQIKSGNNPQVFAHTTPNQFHVFDKKYFGTTTDDGYHGKAFYFGETREATPNMIQKSKKPLGPNKEVPKVSYSGKPKYFYLKGDRRYNMSDPARDFFQEQNKVNFIGNSDSKAFQEIMVGQPEQIKNARAITYDDNGNFIPLSKRDDFTNPDFRYKKGAKILIKKKR